MSITDWRDTLQRNWIYMLAAGLLSLLLWVAVNARSVMQEVVTADLVVINSDRRYVITGREPQAATADVLFTGRAGDLVALSMMRPRLVVMIDSVESQLQKVPLAPDMVRGREGRGLGDVRALTIVHPDTIRLHFEPRAQKMVSVIPRLAVSMADGFTVSDSIRVRPGAVLVEGPESVVSRVDSLSTMPVSREGLSETIQIDVPIERPPYAGLQFSSSTVQVTIPVDDRIERVLSGVSVQLDGDPEELTVEPSRVDVLLFGPRSKLERLQRDRLVPLVSLPQSVEIGARIPVTLGSLPPFVRARVRPDSVIVVPVAAGSQDAEAAQVSRSGVGRR